MRKAIALVGLGVMVVGLYFTAFGTQQVRGAPTSTCALQGPCPISIALNCTTSPGGVNVITCTIVNETNHQDFTLNYIGGAISLIGAIGFGVAYPTKRSDHLRGYSLFSNR